MPAPNDYGFTIDIPVAGEWDNLAGVRSSLEACVALMFRSVEQRATLAMVTGELLENAVKYGSWHADKPTMCRLRLWGMLGGSACVEVANPVAEPSDVEVVFRTIRGIAEAASPALAYQQRLLEIASDSGKHSRLGLLRIAYEGGCEIDARVDDHLLVVTARLPEAA